jgi:steroid delta-isomerase-like uncharacterized protein
MNVKLKMALIPAAALVLFGAGIGLARTAFAGDGDSHENGKRIAELSAPAVAADDVVVTAHVPHEYTPYEKLILKNVSQFHKNFNAREFDKNGDLVADNLRVNSLGTTVTGRAAFVARIRRFVGPFPDVKINDQIILVDGNSAITRFTITGTQKGDLQTPEGVIPATGKQIHIDGIELFTFDKDGKLTDLVTCENQAQLIQQLKAPN